MRKVLISAAAMLMVVGVAQANLNPGQSFVNPVLVGTPYAIGAVDAVTTYTQLVDTMTTNLTLDFGGTVTSSVYKDLNTGFLAFQYQVSVTSIVSPPSPMRSVTIGGNFWSLVDVFSVGADTSGNTTADGAGWTNGAPGTIGRTPNGAPTVVFDDNSFAGTFLNAGNSTANFWYTTNATGYMTANLAGLDSGLIGKAPVFVPAPVPAAAGLVLIGLPLVSWLKRRFA